jgi:hypothetical protein
MLDLMLFLQQGQKSIMNNQKDGSIGPPASSASDDSSVVACLGCQQCSETEIGGQREPPPTVAQSHVSDYLSESPMRRAYDDFGEAAMERTGSTNEQHAAAATVENLSSATEQNVTDRVPEALISAINRLIIWLLRDAMRLLHIRNRLRVLENQLYEALDSLSHLLALLARRDD